MRRKAHLEKDKKDEIRSTDGESEIWVKTPPNKFEGAIQGSIDFEGGTPGCINNAKLKKCKRT
ncbi:hypothetical protein ES703_70657 [subsurface metagenome]